MPPHPMPGIKHNMETVDEDILDYSVKFTDKAKKDGKPFFLWMTPPAPTSSRICHRNTKRS